MVNKGRRSQQFVINSGNNKIRVTALTLGPICYNEDCNNLREEMAGIGVTLRSQQIMGEVTTFSDTERMRGSWALPLLLTSEIASVCEQGWLFDHIK